MSYSRSPVMKRRKLASTAQPSSEETMKDASNEVQTLQSYCFSCGSESITLKPNNPRRKGHPLLMRHRCTKCRKFTGDTYVETTTGVYVVYKIDPKVYAHRNSEQIQKSESTAVVNNDASLLETQESKAEKSDDVTTESSPVDGVMKHICEGKGTDKTAPHPLRIKIAGGRIVESSISIELQKAQITDCVTVGDVEQEKGEQEMQQLRNSHSFTANQETLVGDKAAKAPVNSSLAMASITARVLLQSVPVVEKKMPNIGIVAEERIESDESNEPEAVITNIDNVVISSIEKEDASNGTAITPESNKLNNATGNEEIPKHRIGCGRRRRPLTMRKKTGGRMSRCRSPSTEAESIEEGSGNNVNNKSTELESTVLPLDVRMCASKVKKKDDIVKGANVNVEDDRRLICSGETASGATVENLKRNIKDRKQEISSSTNRRRNNAASVSASSKPKIAPVKKLENKSTVNAAISKRMNSLGTQTLLDDKTEHLSSPTDCKSSQTSNETLTEYVLEEWSKNDEFSFDGNDLYGVLRRLKMACVMLKMQKNEMEKLREKNRFMNELFASARNVIDDLKKTFLSELLRIRGDVSSLGNEFRLYHLDLKRACDTCAVKAKEDTRRFELVAAKYEEDKRKLKEQLETKEQELNLCHSIIDSKTRDLLVADRDVHLANERVANIQKKLEDKLFVATNTKCTSCNVFDKYRDVLTTQIADKTTALASATNMLNEVRVKLEKQERAARILTKENEKTRFERDAWRSDSKRLENEVKYLREQLAALSNDASVISVNAPSTPSDNSGSGNRLINDSRPLRGASEVRDSPTTSSSTSHIQSPILAETAAARSGRLEAISPTVCPPPPEPPAFFNKWNTSKRKITTQASRLELSEDLRVASTSSMSTNEEPSHSGLNRGSPVKNLRDSGGGMRQRSQTAMKRRDESRNEHFKRRILEKDVRDRSKIVDNERIIQRGSQCMDRYSVRDKAGISETPPQISRVDDTRSREDNIEGTKGSLRSETEHSRDRREHLKSPMKGSPPQIARGEIAFRLSSPPKPPSLEVALRSGESYHKRKIEIDLPNENMKKNARSVDEERRETADVTYQTKSSNEVSSTCEGMLRKSVEQLTKGGRSAVILDEHTASRSFSHKSLTPRCSRSPSFYRRSGHRNDRSHSRESSRGRRRDRLGTELVLRGRIEVKEEMHSWRNHDRGPLSCSAISETNEFAYLNDPFCSRPLEIVKSEESWLQRNEASWRSECGRVAFDDDGPPRRQRGCDESQLNRLTFEEETRRYPRDERWRSMEDEPSTSSMMQHRRMPRRHQLVDAASRSRSGGGVWNGPFVPPRRGIHLSSSPQYERRLQDGRFDSADDERMCLLSRRTTFSGLVNTEDERSGIIPVEDIPWERERRRDEQWSDPADWHTERLDFTACDRHWL